jgi:O-antigen/teichoic acid export membrane protein
MYFKRLGKDMVAYGLMAALNRGIGFLLLPIFTRVFSPSEYGVIDIVATLTSLFCIFVSMNLNSSLARFWFEKNGKIERKLMFTTMLAAISLVGCLALALTLACGLAQLAATLLLGDPSLSHYILLGASGAFFTALSTIPEIILRMERKIYRYNLANIIGTAGYALLALSLVFATEFGLTGVFLANLIAAILKLLVALWWTRSYFGCQFSRSTLRSAFGYSLPMLPALLIAWINSQADRILILTFLGLSSVGVFSAASRIAILISFLVLIFDYAWSPLALEIIEKNDRNEFYRKTLNYYAGVVGGLSLVIVLFSRDLMQLLVPSDYWHGYIVIPWLTGAIALAGSASITNLGMLVSKRTGRNSVAAGYGAAINIVLGLLLIPAFGLVGSAIGSFIANFVFTGLLWRFSVQAAGIGFDARKILGIVVLYIAVCCMALATYEWVENQSFSLLIRSIILLGVFVFFGKIIFSNELRYFCRR